MQETENKIEAGSTDGMKHYRVTVVEPVEPPTGAVGKSWYRYVLEDGNSIIKGQRQGTRTQVTQHARDFAGELNARNRNGYRTTWSPRGKKR